MSKITRRSDEHDKFAKDTMAALDKAIKTEQVAEVEKVVQGVLAKRKSLALEADGLETERNTAHQLLKTKGASVLPPEVQELVDAKVAMGLPYDDAVTVALRQVDHEKKLPEENKPKKAAKK